jgi:hypothetical protein
MLDDNLIEKLEWMSRRFGQTKSAFMRGLILKAWIEHQKRLAQKEARQPEQAA